VATGALTLDGDDAALAGLLDLFAFPTVEA